MTWHAVYRTTDGEVLSYTTVLPDPMPSRTASVVLGDDEPDQANFVWDAASKTLVARPVVAVVSVVDQLMNQPEIAALTSTTRTDVRAAAERVLG